MFLVYNEKKISKAIAQGNHAAKKKIGYFAYFLPWYTESQTYRELLQLRKLGVQVFAFSLKKELPGPIPNEAMPLLESTEILRKKNIFYRIGIYIAYLILHPFRYLKAAFLQFFQTPLNPIEKFRSLVQIWDGIVLARLLLKNGVEHLHIHHTTRAASIGLIAHRLSKIPYSLTVYSQDLNSDDRQQWAKLKNADFIICQLVQQREWLLEKYPTLDSEKVHVIRPGLDPSLFAPPEKSAEQMHQYRLISLTHLETVKGIDMLLKACKILDARGLDFETIIIGEGKKKLELQTMANEYRLNHRVRFSGALRMEEIIETMSRADLFILPSRKEEDDELDPLPMALIEAMAMGLPVVTYDSEAIAELVDETTGRRLSEEDPVKWADVIEELLTHTYLCNQLGQAARKRVEEQFHIEKNAKKIAELFGLDPEVLEEEALF